MFKVTSAAVEQIKKAAREGATQGLALRMAARQRADGTIDYRMGFDEGKDEDISFDADGVKIVMAPEYVPLLDEATMDFVEMEKGELQFIFLNPKDPSYSPPSQT